MGYRLKSILQNEKKTKQMLVTTPQMSRVHGLGEIVPSIAAKGQTLESLTTFKLLGTWLNEHLKSSVHVKQLVSCYGFTVYALVLLLN